MRVLEIIFKSTAIIALISDGFFYFEKEKIIKIVKPKIVYQKRTLVVTEAYTRNALFL